MDDVEQERGGGTRYCFPVMLLSACVARPIGAGLQYCLGGMNAEELCAGSPGID